MKKLGMLAGLVFVAWIPFVLAQEAAPAGVSENATVKRYYCPMDGYLSEKPGYCPICGMKLPEKEMTLEEADRLAEEAQKKGIL